jgi:hypothetical protein
LKRATHNCIYVSEYAAAPKVVSNSVGNASEAFDEEKHDSKVLLELGHLL